MDILIKEVTNKRDLDAFVQFPHLLYKDNPYWVPAITKDELVTLDKKLNPAFGNCDAKFWMAYKGTTPVGRIAGIINHDYLKKWKKSYARFGWMDFIDDAEVSAKLLSTVEKWAEENQMKAVHGPLGFTDFDPEGMLLEGFEKLSVMTTIYNYAYYKDHLLNHRYIPDCAWVEFEVQIPRTVPERIARMTQISKSRYHVSALKAKSPSQLLPYARDVFHLINKSYSHLYGTVNLNERQIDFYLNQFFTFIDPDFCSIILNENNEVVAFAIAMPSLSKALRRARGKLFPFGWFHLFRAFKSNSLADLYLIAVDPEMRGKGIPGLIIEDLIQKFSKRKITRAITHPMLEDNDPVINFWKQFDHAEFRRRGCFIKELSNGVN